MIKILGAICIILSCGGMGFSMAAAHRREESTLHQVIGMLDFMGCELQYRLTPLPELCRMAAEEARGPVAQVLESLTQELENQISPDATICMNMALEKAKKLPTAAEKNLKMLGASLGRFDLQGQLQGIESVRAQCRKDLAELEDNRDQRLRSYQTLGLCAGCALAILFL